MIAGPLVLVGVLLVLGGVARMALDMADWSRPKPTRLATVAVFAALGCGVALVVAGMVLAGRLG